jgi:hypothetical protein
MVPENLQAKFVALGIDLERTGELARAIAVLFFEYRLTELQQLAVLRLVEGGVRFSAEEGFEAKAAELLATMDEGDRATRERFASEMQGRN